MKRLVVLLIITASTAHGEIYIWTDSRGTSNYTNRLDEIPLRYRSKAKPLNYGDDVHTAGPTGQPAGQPQSVQPETSAGQPVPSPQDIRQERKLQRANIRPKPRRSSGQGDE